MLERDFYILKLIKAKERAGLKLIRGGEKTGKSTLLKKLYERKELGHSILLDRSSLSELRKAYEKNSAALKRKMSLLFDDVDKLDPEETELILSLAKIENLCIYTTCTSCIPLKKHKVWDDNKVEIFPLYPLSFSQFLNFYSLANNATSLEKYENSIAIFPLHMRSVSEPVALSIYLDELSNAKAFLRREYGIRKDETLHLLRFIATNIGRILSIGDISHRTKLDKKCVSTILEKFEDQNMIVSIPGYDELKDELLSSGRKYYISDNYFIRKLSGESGCPLLLENMVAIELLRREERLFYGVESTFVAFSDYEKKIFRIEENGDEVESQYEDSIRAEKKYVIEPGISSIRKNGVQYMTAVTFLSGKW